MHTPGVCIACKGGTDRQCVDTLQKVGNWRVYICSQCVAEAAGLMGFVNVERVHDLTVENANLVDTIGQISQELSRARSEHIQVVPVEDVVPYIKREKGRPRKTDAVSIGGETGKISVVEGG